MPTSPFLGFQELTTNQTGKETTINTALLALESASNATLLVDMSAGNVTLSASQFGGSFIFKTSGLTANRILNLPAQINGINVQRIFAIRNASATFAVTVQVTGGAGSNVQVPAGETRLLDVDGSGNVHQVSLPSSAASVITDTTANRNLAITDANTYVRMNNASSNTVTIQPNATVAYPVGTVISVEQAGVGSTSFIAGAGVTILTAGGLTHRTKNSLVRATQIAVDTWILFGDLGGQLVVTQDATTNRNLVMSDAASLIEMTNASANTVTVQQDAAVNMPIGTNIWITQGGAGQTTVIAGTSVTIHTGGNLTTRSQWSLCRLTKIAANEWIWGGDIGGFGTTGGGATSPVTVTTETASYTLQLSDAETFIRMNVGGANTITIPKNTTVAFPVGTRVYFSQAGAGLTSFAAATGVTLNSRGGAVNMAGQYAIASIVQVAADTWTLTGDIS